MARIILYTPGRSASDYYPSDRKSNIADTFGREIRLSLREKILPGEFGDRFDPADAELYIERRIWVAAGVPPGQDFAYEQLIHRSYWPSVASSYPLVVVNGVEGIGKSTLLRFYFDCYLPHYDRFPYVDKTEWDADEWKREVNKHLVLYFDLRRSTTSDQVKRQMFKSFRQQIMKRSELRDISVRDDFAMWERATDWHDPLHQLAEKACPSREAYRADYIKPLFYDDELFVGEVLWYLGHRQDADGKRERYISIVLDNLDQQDLDIKRYVLKTILGWVESEKYYWKIILPLRPESLRELAAVLQPYGLTEVIEIGGLDQQTLVEKRSARIEQDIRNSGKQVEREEYIDKHGNIAYVPIPNFLAPAYVKNMLVLDLQADRYHPVKGVALRHGMRGFIENFCNGSVRRFLRLRARLAMSVPIERSMRRRSVRKDDPLPDYVFLSGLLTGGRDHFDKDDADNDVVNLYDTTAQPRCAYTTLIGIHVLYLIRGRTHTRNELLERLTRIGYTEGEVLDCLDTLYNGCFFKRENMDASDDYRILKEARIIDAYVDLIVTPAYTDNMAIVTPVEEHLQREMVHTVSYDISQFKARTKTSRSFLSQIREDENTVRTWKSDSPRHRTDAKTFKTDFDSLGLPSIYRKAALEYRERIMELERNPKGLKDVMNAEDWEEIIHDNVLLVEANEANIPLKATIG